MVYGNMNLLTKCPLTTFYNKKKNILNEHDCFFFTIQNKIIFHIKHKNVFTRVHKHLTPIVFF